MPNFIYREMDDKIRSSTGVPVIRHVFQNGPWSRNEVRNRLQQQSNEAQRQGFNGEIQLAIKVDKEDRGKVQEIWKMGYATPVGEEVMVPATEDAYDESPDIAEQVNAFVVSYIVLGEPAGGCDGKGNNDCLFDCIKKIVGEAHFKWTQPKTLKQYLGLQRTGKVDISLMKKLDYCPIFKLYKLNVTGDHTY